MSVPASTLPPPPSQRRRGAGPERYRSWIWAGAVLVVLGVASVIGCVVRGVIDIDRTVDSMVRTPEGSVVDFALDSPQDWTIYVEPQSATMTGLHFSVLDGAGERVELRDYDGDLTYSVTGHSGIAVATVTLAAGNHQLVVDGTGPRTVAIGPSVGGRILTIVLWSVVLGVLLIGGGAVLVIVGALRQSRAVNRRAVPPPRSSWSTGEWPDPGASGTGTGK
jgi:hypothetical protein